MVFEKSKYSVITSRDMRDIEQNAIKNGIEESFMMEEAGRNSAHIIRKVLPCSDTQKIAFIIGKSNNGGDGIVSAGVLSKEFGIKCDLFFFMDSYDSLGDLPKQKYSAHIENNENVSVYFNEFSQLSDNSYPVVVDALFGTGFKGVMREDAKLLIETVNRLKENFSSIVSLDVPSGIDELNIEDSYKDAVIADITISMGALKEANVVKPAKFCNGSLIVASIGVERSFFKAKSRGGYINNRIIDLEEKTGWNSHKYKKGKVFIIAGSQGMSGAAVMAAKAALKLSGAVRCAFPNSISASMENNLLEPVKIYCEDNNQGFFTQESFSQLEDQLTWADSVLIGPGIGRNSQTKEFVKKILIYLQKECENKDIVLDADALAVIDTLFLKKIKSENNNIIITPHEGEFKRLFNEEKTAFSFSQKTEMIKNLAEKYSISIILKGPDTYIATPSSSTYMINFAQDYIAKAGSGDVLAGITTSVCSFSKSPLKEKLCASVAMHSYAAQKAAEAESKQTLLPTDIIKHIKEYFLEKKGANIYA